MSVCVCVCMCVCVCECVSVCVCVCASGGCYSVDVILESFAYICLHNKILLLYFDFNHCHVCS